MRERESVSIYMCVCVCQCEYVHVCFSVCVRERGEIDYDVSKHSVTLSTGLRNPLTLFLAE